MSLEAKLVVLGIQQDGVSSNIPLSTLLPWDLVANLCAKNVALTVERDAALEKLNVTELYALKLFEANQQKIEEVALLGMNAFEAENLELCEKVN